MNKKMLVLLAPEGVTPATTTQPAETPPAPATTLGADPQTTEPQKTEPQKTEQPPAAQTTTPPTPAEIEIKLPEGVTLDPATLDKFKPLAKEFGLDSAKAQKLVDLQVEALNAQRQQADAAWGEQRTQWVETAKKDAEFGGAKFAENVKVAQAAIEKFGGPALKKALNDYGLGDHPELIRFAYRVGKAISEDSIRGATAAPAAGNDQDAKLREAFPSMFK
jgi:hypothetical protein